MAEIYVDVSGETCPVPLVEMRKAVRKAQAGDVIVITGNNAASKKEIPMAADALALDVINIEEEDGTWIIKIQK